MKEVDQESITQRNSKPISREIQSNRYKHSNSVEKKEKKKKKKEKEKKQKNSDNIKWVLQNPNRMLQPYKDLEVDQEEQCWPHD